MNNFLNHHFSFSPKQKRRFFCLTLLICLIVFFCGCNRSIDYFSYVSELRANLLLAQDEQFSVRVYSLYKEQPYIADGIKQECVERTEIRLIAPSGEQTCQISFTFDGKEYGGEMSFDNVKCEYFYACPLNIGECETLALQICYGETQTTLNAQSVLSKDALRAKDALNKLIEAEKELFESMTDRYGFAGEIYLRLLYEDAPYYYIGVMDRNGGTHAFLMNALTGKILARRQS